VQRRQDLPNCKNLRQDLTTMLKITVDNILTKHELQVRQPVVFVTSGCSDVVKLEGTPKGVPDADCSHALRILLRACHPNDPRRRRAWFWKQHLL